MGTTKKSDLKSLSSLGKTQNKPSKTLETFPNHNPNRKYLVTLQTEEFTCLCPATGQPDIATIKIQYIPNTKIVESKSLKMYFWSYRNKKCFHEHVTNVILDDLVKALDPHWCSVTGDFAVRGGIAIQVQAEHGSK